jgi:hypothetical protein
MEYEMNNGMLVEVTYFADQHDRKLIEIDSVTWRDIGIMHALMTFEMDELFSACYQNELDLAICAAEDRADAMRDGS